MNQYGKEISLSSFNGKWVVIYFYPKDDTPGCTLEATQFTSMKKKFEELGVIILGVSPDSKESHCKFIRKHDLEITLLTDPYKETLRTYGAYGKKLIYGKEVEGVIRSTFLINPDGEIAFSWKNVKADGHAQEVFYKLKELV